MPSPDKTAAPGCCVLAFDTSGPWCSAALLIDGAVADRAHTDLSRGQAEVLLPMVEGMLRANGISLGDLSAIGVGIGPGNFTGIRISVAAARGLALGSGVPAVGVSLFQVLVQDQQDGPILASLPAPRGLAYVQRLQDEAPQGAARLIDPAAPPQDLGITPGTRVIGHRAAEIAAPFAAPWTAAGPEDIAARIARITAHRLHTAPGAPRPAPLYVRPADAAPPREAPVPILP